MLRISDTNKKIKINFVDFWPNFQKKDNYFFHLLSQEYEVFLDEIDPDVVIGSYGFSNEKEIFRYKDHRSLKIYYTGEKDGPKSHPYDACMTQHRIEDKNHFRIPLWAFFTSWFDEMPFVHSRDPSFLMPWRALDKSRLDLEEIFDSKKRFCSFIYADLTNERKKWFDIFGTVGHIDSAGSCLNNMGGKIPGRGDQIYKLAFLSDYYFSLSIENSCVDGYVTEKLLHPMTSITIPAYWGDPNIDEDINIESIIDLRKSTNEILDELRSLSNKKNYLDKLSKPWFNIDHDKRYKKDALNFIKTLLLKKNINL